MTAIKICGITRPDDAVFAVQQGADYLGFNFWPSSKRHIDRAHGAVLARCARRVGPATRCVGLFVDAPVADVLATASAIALDVVQLHGDETPEDVAAIRAAGFEVWKAIAVDSATAIEALGAWPADGFVLDAPSPGRGGSGQTFDWSHAAAAVAAGHRVILAGGLTSANVATAIQAVHPFAVDVASGVESAPGDKDPLRVFQFVTAVRRRATYLAR